MKTFLLAIAASVPLAALLPASAADAQGRAARCVVTLQGSPTYRGPCRFLPEGRGDFVITPPRSRLFPNDATGIGVYLIRPGLADVAMLTPTGPSTLWGRATRSRRDRACWVGANFSVCAY